MVDSSRSSKKRKEFINEGDIATLLQRYDTMTILKLLQEMAYHAQPKMDWNELVKKTSTGITSASEYQLLWRHLAYRDSLLPIDDNAHLQDDDSDMEFELEASPAVSVDAVAEAVAHVKVISASYVPSESDIPEESTFEAPLSINIPYGLQRRPQEPSDSYWSSRGMNITFPIFLQKAAEGHYGNGSASNMGPRKKRKKWSAEEDEELIAAVKRHGEGSWALIAKEEFQGEITVSQLSQRWGSIRRRCDILNSSTQSCQQRTEAANRALSLAVGNRVPSKKVAVGIPPVLTSGSITGAQDNGANGGSSLQGQQQAKPVVQSIPRAATSVQTPKSRVTATANSTLRAELMVTANSVATAACMSEPATAPSVPKVELGKNALPALVPKVKSSLTSLPRPSGISSVMNVEPVKTALAASFPRPLGTIAASKAGPFKTASAAVLPRPSGIISAAPKADLVKTDPAVSLIRPSGIISSPKAEPRKNSSAASSPHPASMLSAPMGEPVKNVSAAATTTTKTQVVGSLSIRNAVNGSTKHVISSAPFNKPSPTAPFSKGPTIQNSSVPSGFASSKLAPTQSYSGYGNATKAKSRSVSYRLVQVGCYTEREKSRKQSKSLGYNKT